MAVNPDNLPYFQLFIDEWFASPTVIGMSRSAQALYLGCLMRQWQRGHLPNDLALIRRLVGWDEGEFSEFWPEVSGFFEEWDDGNLRNEACERKRAKYVAKVANGRRGGRPKPKAEPKPEPRAEPKRQPKQNPLSLSPSPSIPPAPDLFEEREGVAAVAAPAPRRWARSEGFPDELRPWLSRIDAYLDSRTANSKAPWDKGKRLTAAAARRLASDLRKTPEGLRDALLDDAAEGSWRGLSRALSGEWIEKNQGRAQRTETVSDESQEDIRRAAAKDVLSRPVFDPSGRAQAAG